LEDQGHVLVWVDVALLVRLLPLLINDALAKRQDVELVSEDVKIDHVCLMRRSWLRAVGHGVVYLGEVEDGTLICDWVPALAITFVAMIVFYDKGLAAWKAAEV
jgi:hypothetical protein